MKSKDHVVNIAAAKARLPELVERAAGGEVIILARNGKPRARLAPLVRERKYVSGAGKGKWKSVRRILDKPLPDEVLDAFYGGAVFAGKVPGKAKG
jgi:prevent-host-death family protein